MGLFDFLTKQKKEKLDEGLSKTREGLLGKISRLFSGKSKVDGQVLDNLEEILISSDVGIDTTVKIIERIEKRVSKDKYVSAEELNLILKEEVAGMLSDNKTEDVADFEINSDTKPFVIMVVGVNGVGKTTTIGKLAYQFKQKGKNVLLGAGDTFRAAAVDQLKIWSERVGVPIVMHKMGSDPGAVAFDAVSKGVSLGSDIVIIDTAGRLHNKIHLMDELSKMVRVVKKVIPDAPHEVLLVLDASTGQNAIEQARHFTAATQVTAIALTKLDGTAKGGVVLGIADQFNIPVKYIGVGESIEDLQVFNRMAFVDSLFQQ